MIPFRIKINVKSIRLTGFSAGFSDTVYSYMVEVTSCHNLGDVIQHCGTHFRIFRALIPFKNKASGSC